MASQQMVKSTICRFAKMSGWPKVAEPEDFFFFLRIDPPKNSFEILRYLVRLRELEKDRES